MNLNEEHDLIIGCIDRYNWDQIKFWANSIKKSGFKGKKAVIAYNIDAQTIKKLVEEDFTIFSWEQDKDGYVWYKAPRYNVCVERFAHYWFFLSKIESPIRFVIATDVRDVVFQHNPSEFLSQQYDNMLLPNDFIVASGENIRYQDEPWSKNNMIKSFGNAMFNHLEDKEINCAGVIAGTRKAFVDLSLQIFLLCASRNPHVEGGGGPDQAAYNILINSFPWFPENVIFTSHYDRWACQAGTTVAALDAGSGEIGRRYYMGEKDLINKFLHGESFLGYGNPHDKEPNTVQNSNLEDYYIVHQYDRIPLWKEKIENKYAL